MPSDTPPQPDLAPTPPLPRIVTEPVYQQLARVCRDEIARGHLLPHQRFPSEREIAERFGVSRATANKVISNMVAEGLLVFRPGIGTFVTERHDLSASLRQIESFTEHARALGLEPETRVLSFESVALREAPSPVRAAFDLDAETPLFAFERLRLADGEPVILESRWIPAERVPRLRWNQLAGSFYRLLETEYGLRHTGERHVIHARGLTPDEAMKLALDPGAAALVVEGPGFASDGAALWYQVLLYRGDRYSLVNEIGTPQSADRLVVSLNPNLTPHPSEPHVGDS